MYSLNKKKTHKKNRKTVSKFMQNICQVNLYLYEKTDSKNIEKPLKLTMTLTRYKFPNTYPLFKIQSSTWTTSNYS